MNNWMPNTTSRYVQTVDTNTFHNYGVSQSSESGTIILSFGQPKIINSQYKVYLYDYATIVTTDQIKAAVEAFADGWYTAAQYNPDAKITLVVGLNNCGDGPGLCGPAYNLTIGYGLAWSNMVNDIISYVHDIAHNYSDKITVISGMDIEPNYNTVQNTNNWLTGFFSVNNIHNADYGSCDGCPAPTPSPNTIISCNNGGGSINNGWKLDDIYHVSYGLSLAYAMPEIYLTDSQPSTNSEQWYAVSLYGYLCHTGARLYFTYGLLTQYQACIDRPDYACSHHQTDNSPSEGWAQLFKAISADSRTSIDPGYIQLPTDITWQR
jgi:hypothetical protein